MRPPSGLDVHDLRVVVAGLVGEFGVDVHYLVGELLDRLREQVIGRRLGPAGHTDVLWRQLTARCF